jgi:hypothetical protein
LGETQKENNYQAILLKAIDEALLTLGKNVQVSIYFHLETKFGLPRKQIPNNIVEFSDALEKIFGEASKKIEILIMKFLNDKVQCNYKWAGPSWLVPNLTFEEYVKMVQQTIQTLEKGCP